ncbi:MAG: FAD-binding oxidoreductase [Acidisphaera sp.]|nr:FAD-binding oxidoreductase [Acidisphaera sp.]
MHQVFHPDWQARPFWWDAVPPRPADDPLPSQADVVIVGSGFCGLSAARTLAAAGRSVAVLDARDPGYGASTRNHGMLSGGLKIAPDLDRRVTPQRAAAIRRTSFESFAFTKDLIRTEALQVDYAHTGRFIAAHSRSWYERLKQRRDDLVRHFGYHVRMVPRAEQRREIGSDLYHGGIVIEESGSVHPAKLHRALWDLAQAAGARVFGNAEVQAITGSEGAFTVCTVRGEVRAGRVIIAANAYAGRFNRTMSPYLRRRVIPVTAYLIATEELPADLARTLMPTDRMGTDTQRWLYAFRLSPDGRRIIFNGRPRLRDDVDERTATPLIHRHMCKVWPALQDYRVTHSWKGLVGFTFDRLPHVGVDDGVLHAAGCQGNGVALMSYLGHQMGLKVLTGAQQQCGHDGLPFPTSRAYSGTPWFLPIVGAYYRSRDAVDRLLSGRGTA